jgi:serine/threonine protein phosphatase 1
MRVLKRLLRRDDGGRRERRRLRAGPEITMPAPAPDAPLWAIGDLHGRADLARGLVERILAEPDPGPGGPLRLVFLGDYIDRGPDAVGTLRLLEETARAGGIEATFLMGNHEAMLLGFLEDPVREARWLRAGGLATCLSFGVGAYATDSPAELARVRDELAAAIAPHRAFLAGLAMRHLSGNVLLAHAGADPRLPPERQEAATLLWGHPDFERVPRRDGLWVVHGHRVVDAPRMERGRIALDTGAYFSGCLSAARIGPDGVRFLSETRGRGGAAG